MRPNFGSPNCLQKQEIKILERQKFFIVGISRIKGSLKGSVKDKNRSRNGPDLALKCQEADNSLFRTIHE